MITGRRGFVLIELLVTFAFVALLAGLAVPHYQGLQKRAVAARAVGAIRVIRQAAYAHNEATGRWPDGAPEGVVPPALRRYLPEGFLFAQPDFDLGWRFSGFSEDGEDRTIQLVQVRARDAAVCQAVADLLGGAKNRDLVNLCGSGPGLLLLAVES